MAYHYSVHGLILSLPFPCDLLGAALPSCAADVTVREGDVPAALENAAFREDDVDVAPMAFLLRGGARSARFLVENGSSVTVRKAAGCEDALFFHHLLYPVIAALLRQRGLLVFHASAALLDGQAVLVAGDSGAGKSTAIAGLMKRGWIVQSDDVSAVRISPSGGIDVLPGAAHIHLDETATAGLALDTRGLARRDWHRMKMAVPAVVPARRPAVPLRRLVWLGRREGGLEIGRVEGRAKLPFFLHALYGPLLPEQVAGRSAALARLLADVDLLVIARPGSGWTADAVIDAIADERPAPIGAAGISAASRLPA